MSRGKQNSGPYLVAEPAGFPGVKIPLLTDEECRERGIEPGRFPPRETWTQQQRDAADRLAEILLPAVYREALEVILAELERLPVDFEASERDKEKVAASRGIALIDARKWKQRDTTIHFPPSWVRQILESFVNGRLSLCEPQTRTPRSGTHRNKQDLGATQRRRC